MTLDSFPAQNPPSSESSDDYDDHDWDRYCMLFPVFCTTDVPPETQDNLLRANTRNIADNNGALLHIVTSPSVAADVRASWPPSTAFATPFAGMSLSELAAWFEDRIAGGEHWPEYSFAVLDARSLEDGRTCVIARTKVPLDGDDDGSEEEEEDDGPAEKAEKSYLVSYRCEFGVSLDQMIVQEHVDANVRWTAEGALEEEGVFTVQTSDALNSGTFWHRQSDDERAGADY